MLEQNEKISIKFLIYKECWGLKELEHSARNQQLTKNIKIKYWTHMSRLEWRKKYITEFWFYLKRIVSELFSF